MEGDLARFQAAFPAGGVPWFLVVAAGVLLRALFSIVDLWPLSRSKRRAASSTTGM